MVSALADVSWQRTRTLMLSGNNAKQWVGPSQNYRHSRIYCLLRESAKHLGDVARERTSPYSAPFRSFLSRCPPPSLYAAAHFSDIIACSALTRVATGAHENPRNKVAAFPETGFRKCVWWSFNAVSKTVLQLVKSKGHL